MEVGSPVKSGFRLEPNIPECALRTKSITFREADSAKATVRLRTIGVVRGIVVGIPRDVITIRALASLDALPTGRICGFGQGHGEAQHHGNQDDPFFHLKAPSCNRRLGFRTLGFEAVSVLSSRHLLQSCPNYPRSFCTVVPGCRG